MGYIQDKATKEREIVVEIGEKREGGRERVEVMSNI